MPLRTSLSSARLLTSSHPDWDIQALNDEMEGLIGKFDDSSEGSNIPTRSSLMEPNKRQLSTENVVTNNACATSVFSSNKVPKTMPSVIKKTLTQPQSEQKCSKPSYTIFYFDEKLQEEFISDQATLSHKYWHHFTSLDSLVEELADEHSNGIIFLQNQVPSTLCETISPAQKNLLKIYSKSSSVALVIGKKCTSLPSNNSDGSTDISFASYVIQGFEPKDGIAAAIAGMKSLSSVTVDIGHQSS